MAKKSIFNTHQVKLFMKGSIKDMLTTFKEDQISTKVRPKETFMSFLQVPCLILFSFCSRSKRDQLKKR